VAEPNSMADAGKPNAGAADANTEQLSSSLDNNVQGGFLTLNVYIFNADAAAYQYFTDNLVHNPDGSTYPAKITLTSISNLCTNGDVYRYLIKQDSTYSESLDVSYICLDRKNNLIVVLALRDAIDDPAANLSRPDLSLNKEVFENSNQVESYFTQVLSSVKVPSKTYPDSVITDQTEFGF